MKLNKLTALGLTAALAFAGVSVSQFEGEELTGYLDPVGVATACYGHTETAEVGKRYTEDECLELLAKDLSKHNAQMMQVIAVPLSQGEHVAYLSFHYNVGAGNFRRSSLLKRLNAGQRERACDELTRWVYAKGRKLKGLVKRRQKERDMCLKGVRNAQNNI